MKIDKIIKIAKRNNLSGITICDHNVFSYPKIKKELKNKNENFIMIPGMEIKTEYGDLIGIMLTEEIKLKNYYECIDEIRSQGGISILPHPYRRKKKIDIKKISKKVDWIEVNNSRSSIRQNKNAKELSEALTKPQTAGSDAHLYGEIGRSYISLKEVVSVDEIIKEISKKNIKLKYNISSPSVHYWSSIIGTLKTREFKNFFKGVGRKFKNENKKIHI
jgi:predicted metal-dependent phosphoesterase TrpH